MGYKWPSDYSKDPSLPDFAVMGGAMAAVLTAWRDEAVIEMFQNEEQQDGLWSLLLKSKPKHPSQGRNTKKNMMIWSST
jgi:hypothetical protein